MPLMWLVIGFLFVCGLLFAVAVAGFLRMYLVEAAEHENRVLPFLHIAWLASIAFFAVHGFRFF